MPYVDGFVIPVPNDKRDAYVALALSVAPMFKEFGALEIWECWGDDVPAGKLTSFPLAVQAEPGETVVFSWIVWPSRAVRDTANARMRTDPRMQAYNPATMPFDGKRMIFGGFEVLVQS